MFSSKRTRVAFALALVFLFWVANRAAYKGYFYGDDLDNLGWNQYAGLDTYVRGFLTPVFNPDNFRPTGHIYFFLLYRWAGLHYSAYVAVVQAIHILNAWILWLLLRRFRIHEIAAIGAVVAFLFHPATLPAYWLPMYVFDLLCGTFCMLSLLFFIDSRWILSFVCFWFAYKAKEIAVMLPAVLLVYEWLLGERRWKPLVPFLLVSLSFGLQALVSNRARQTDYTLSFGIEGALRLASFYGSQLAANWWILATLAGAAVIWVRDRRLVFAFGAALLPMIPLLALPNRVFSVYLYVSVCFLAIGIAILLAKRPGWLVPLFLLVWIPVTFIGMRRYRRETLAWAAENREWVTRTSAFIRSSPLTRAFVYDGFPPSLSTWGVTGALSLLTNDFRIRITPIEQTSAKALLQEPLVGVLVWNSERRQLMITSRNPATPDASYVRMDLGMPVWQFGEGWYLRDDRFRWTKPVATAQLYRPATATRFELQVNAGHQQIRDIKQLRVKAFIDNELLGEATFSEPGWHSVRWPVKSGSQKLVDIRFESTEYRTPRDPRVLGAAIGAFGFR